MKRVCALILTLAVLQCGASSAAANTAGTITLELDENGVGTYSSVTVQPMQVTLNGSTLNCDVPAFARGGRTMVPVRLIAEKLGAVVKWFAESNEVSITLGDRTVRLKIGSAQAQVNGQPVTLYDGVPAMVAKYRGSVRTMVPLRFVSEQLGVWVSWIPQTGTAAVFTSDPAKKTVVLDAGHGGSQTGAVYGGVYEKNINLAITKRVEAMLKSCGYRVVMTQSSDTQVGLYTRANIANTAKADIFVSIHANAASWAPDFAGIYTFYYPSSLSGARLAQTIQTHLCGNTGAIDRGIKGENFVVLRATRMPAVLIETGFMTNQTELYKLTTSDYQDKIAEGIAHGIINYLSTV